MNLIKMWLLITTFLSVTDCQYFTSMRDMDVRLVKIGAMLK